MNRHNNSHRSGAGKNHYGSNNSRKKMPTPQPHHKQHRDPPPRASRWGGYYANKKREGKNQNRHTELDASVAVAINSGSQPTLAKRRRELANHKWETTSTTLESDADRLFRDLLVAHAKHRDDKIAGAHAASVRNSNSNININSSTKKVTANVMLMKARRSFWKRKLSSLSTTDFDAIWNDARNKFIRHIGQGLDFDIAATAPVPNKGPSAKHPAFNPPTPPPTSGGRGTAKPVGREARSATAPDAFKHEAENRRPVADKIDNVVIDLCDTTDSEAEEEGHRTEGTSSSAPRSGDARGDGNDGRKADAPTTKMKTTRVSSDRVELVGRLEKELISSKKIGETKRNHREPPSPKTTTIERTTLLATAAAPIPLQSESQSSRNRWSELFLSPDFRTDFAFSLGECHEIP